MVKRYNEILSIPMAVGPTFGHAHYFQKPIKAEYKLQLPAGRVDRGRSCVEWLYSADWQ